MCSDLRVLKRQPRRYTQDTFTLRVQVSTGEVSQIGQTRLYTSFAPSPDAKFLLAAWLERPYSYTVPCGRFPKRVQLWDRCGVPLNCPAAHFCPFLPTRCPRLQLPSLKRPFSYTALCDCYLKRV